MNHAAVRIAEGRARNRFTPVRVTDLWPRANVSFRSVLDRIVTTTETSSEADRGRAQNEGFTFSKTANSRLSWTVVSFFRGRYWLTPQFQVRYWPGVRSKPRFRRLISQVSAFSTAIRLSAQGYR